jgi:hypothetical protein
MRVEKKQRKQIARFAMVSVLSFIAIEAIERGLSHFLGIEMDNIGVGAGWLLLVVGYGFKTHIICCIVPMLWAAYRCRHRGCDHDHCKTEDKDEPLD